MLLIVLAGFLSSAKRYDLPETYPAKFSSWNKSVDAISFNWKTDPSKYTQLVILPVSRMRVKYDRTKESDDKTNAIINTYLNQSTSLYVKALLPLDGKLKIPVKPGNLNSITGQTLVLQTDVLIVDPGLEGPNTGMVTLKMEARLIDGSSYMELASFSHTISKKAGRDSFKALASCMQELAGEGFGSVIYSLLGE